jgi:dephospho-CoA kinase
MKWIGLTGGIATGKSTVAKILRDQGLPVLDADSLAREVVTQGSKGLAEVAAAFGPSVVSQDGNLDRGALGKLIFADPDQRLKLESILHPLIQEQKNGERLRLENEGCRMAFYDVPLLFEKGLAGDFDATVLVYASVDDQRARLRERDGLDDAAIDLRLAAQMPIDDKIKLADYVIINRSGLAELKAAVHSVLVELGKG